MQTIVRQNETFLALDWTNVTPLSASIKKKLKRKVKKWLIAQRNNDNSNSSNIIFSSLVRL